MIKKEEKKVRLMKETIPFYLSKFDKHLSENGGYSVGSDVSILNSFRITNICETKFVHFVFVVQLFLN